MAPLKFAPIYKSIIWGGKKIAALKNTTIDSDTIGESWEIADIDGNVSEILNTEDRGMNLHQLLEKEGREVLGSKVYETNGANFPLLIKLIDAQDDLSIQVHPNDEVAEKRHHSKGKTEMWYVVDCEPETTLIAGFNKVITREELIRSMEDNSIINHLAIHPVKKDEVYFLPAGRVHAIRRGTVIAEIQQSSNITYRIYDYDRRDKEGNPRQLHVEESKEVITLECLQQAHVPYVMKYNEVVPLASCEYFTTNLLKSVEAHTYRRDLSAHDSFVVYMILDGEGTISSDGGKTSVDVRKGETLLVKACEAAQIVINSSAKGIHLLETYV